MDQLLTQLMAGGILAILVIREVLNFLKTKQNGRQSNASEMGLAGVINRDEFEEHKKQVRYKDVCDAKHEAIRDSLERIEKLILNGRGK